MIKYVEKQVHQLLRVSRCSHNFWVGGFLLIVVCQTRHFLNTSFTFSFILDVSMLCLLFSTTGAPQGERDL